MKLMWNILSDHSETDNTWTEICYQDFSETYVIWTEMCYLDFDETSVM